MVSCFELGWGLLQMLLLRVVPGVVCVLVMMEGLEASMISRMLPDSMRVGSFTIFCNPNSLIISISLLCLLAVLVLSFVGYPSLCQVGLKSPAITTLGALFWDVYSFVRDAWRASSESRWSPVTKPTPQAQRTHITNQKVGGYKRWTFSD